MATQLITPVVYNVSDDFTVFEAQGHVTIFIVTLTKSITVELPLLSDCVAVDIHKEATDGYNATIKLNDGDPTTGTLVVMANGKRRPEAQARRIGMV